MASAASRAVLQRSVFLTNTNPLTNACQTQTAALSVLPRLKRRLVSRAGTCRCDLNNPGREASTESRSVKSASKVETTAQSTALYSFAAPLVLSALASADSPAGGYSQASYYTTLGLFVISAPGLWSLIKRSTKSKVVQKTFVVDGPAKPESKPLDKVASDIATFFKGNNYSIAGTGEVITFEGNVAPSRGQAAFLTFCAALGLLSIALVCSIALPDIGEKWYGITVLSPLAGVYYWRKASRKEQMKVKMVTSDDEALTDVIVEGDAEEIERLRRELDLNEKGKIYVKGILER